MTKSNLPTPKQAQAVLQPLYPPLEYSKLLSIAITRIESEMREMGTGLNQSATGLIGQDQTHMGPLWIAAAWGEMERIGATR